MRNLSSPAELVRLFDFSFPFFFPRRKRERGGGRGFFSPGWKKEAAFFLHARTFGFTNCIRRDVESECIAASVFDNEERDTCVATWIIFLEIFPSPFFFKLYEFFREKVYTYIDIIPYVANIFPESS